MKFYSITLISIMSLTFTHAQNILRNPTYGFNGFDWVRYQASGSNSGFGGLNSPLTLGPVESPNILGAQRFQAIQATGANERLTSLTNLSGSLVNGEEYFWSIDIRADPKLGIFDGEFNLGLQLVDNTGTVSPTVIQGLSVWRSPGSPFGGTTIPLDSTWNHYSSTFTYTGPTTAPNIFYSVVYNPDGTNPISNSPDVFIDRFYLGPPPPVPEPSTGLLCLIACIQAVFYRKRK